MLETKCVKILAILAKHPILLSQFSEKDQAVLKNFWE